MRQVLFAVLITLTVVGLTEGLSLAQFALEPADLSTDGRSLVIAQSSAQKQSVKNAQKPQAKPNQITTPTSDRTAHYQCLEYCVVVRQSCEGLATIQPDVKISKIGSKQNSKWSGECQKIYNGCMKKCDHDENNIHWKRYKLTENKNKKN